MKKILFLSGLVIFLSAAVSSCASNRDCYGVKHTTLSNGVRI